MIPFWKLSGGGNDFIALAEPPAEALSEQRIRRWCRRGLSVGADGVFTIHRQGGDGVRMRHFNPDGGRAALCLNGTRCAARLAFHLGWATGRTRLLTDAGAVEAEDCPARGVRLQLPPPADPPRAVALGAGGRTYEGWWIRVGVPHLVFLWEEGLAQAPVAEVGRQLVHHPQLDREGANVNFVFLPRAGSLEIRTYERGVYGETLACGTGVLSSAFVLASAGRTSFPLEVLTAGGFVLRVGGRWSAGHLESWTLAGDARLVAEGNLTPGAEELPSAPAWTAGPLKITAI